METLSIVKAKSHTKQELAELLEHLPAKQIKEVMLQWLDQEDGDIPEGLESLLVSPEEEEKEEQQPLDREAAHQEWSKKFHAWVESHRGKDIPILSDEALTREGIYQDHL